MPYFEDHNLLFGHISKNAGNSIEGALGLASSTRLSTIVPRSPFNRIATFAQRASVNRGVRKLLHGTLDYAFCAQHLTLQEILLLGLIPRKRLETIKSFAIFRDPFRRALSTFMQFVSREKHTADEFENFCSTWFFQESGDHNLAAHRRQQIDFILDCRGGIGVNRVLRFERLQHDFSDLCRDWEIPPVSIPHVGKIAAGDCLMDLYSSRSRKIISQIFGDDFAFYEASSRDYSSTSERCSSFEER